MAEIPVIESEVPTILDSVVIPVTVSCCEVRSVIDVTPNVAIPVTFKEVTEAIPPITSVEIPAVSA